MSFASSRCSTPRRKAAVPLPGTTSTVNEEALAALNEFLSQSSPEKSETSSPSSPASTRSTTSSSDDCCALGPLPGLGEYVPELVESSDDDTDEDCVEVPDRPRDLPQPMSTRLDRRPEKDLMIHSNDDWEVAQSGDSAFLIEKFTQFSYTVPKRRALKSMKILNTKHICTAMLPKACNCKGRCYNDTTMGAIRNCRLETAICSTEAEVDALLIAKMRAHDGNLVLNGRSVCQVAFAAAFGVAKKRIITCLATAKAGPTAVTAKGKKRPMAGIEQHKYNLCYSFWKYYLDSYCQVPNETTRLFPTDKSYKKCYKEYFTPWYYKNCSENEGIPSFTTFRRAFDHPEFDDVKPTKKHNHGKCATCTILKTKRMRTFLTDEDMQHVLREQRMHDESVRAWRRLEERLKAEAKTNPQDVVVICHDATDPLGTPRLGRRAPKNMTQSRFHWVPWLAQDFGKDRHDFIYMPKSRWHKDANYIITMLQALVMRTKSDYNHPNYQARRLVFIADNAGENKNNELLDWATDVVSAKLFDEIEFFFGEVGHTHNGVDAVFSIHNNAASARVSGTIGHFVKNFPHAFHKNVPHASILTEVYDFKKYYAPHYRPLAGYTKTIKDPEIVRGWKVWRNAENIVEVRWKRDPALDPEWLGRDGTAGSPGFVLRLSTPPGVPQPVQPAEKIMRPDHAAQLKGKMMQDHLEVNDLTEAIQWNFDAVQNGGVVPMDALEDDIPRGEWGRLQAVGATEDTKGHLRTLERVFGGPTRQTMFDLPEGENGEHLEAKSNQYHFSGDLAHMRGQPLPHVRWREQDRESCPVYNHPNNQAHRAKRQRTSPLSGSSNEQLQPAHDVDDGDAIAPDDQDWGVDIDGGLDGDKSDGQDDKGDDDDGMWRHNDDDGYYYELDFAACQEGKHFVTKEIFADGKTGIQVGKVLEITDRDQKEFKAKMYKCTKNCYQEVCIDAQWNISNECQQVCNYAVLMYFDKLTKGKKLPGKQQTELKKRTDIEWTEPHDHE